jgi:hypothetical protein
MVCVPQMDYYAVHPQSESDKIVGGGVVTVLDTAVHDEGDHLTLCEQHAWRYEWLHSFVELP